VSDPNGKDVHVYAGGLRNAVGIACNPESGNLWAAVNERDDIDDETPPDYFTHVVEGGFYGWPYAYFGQQPDRGVAARPDMVAKTITPDVPLEAHAVPLQFAFYEQTQFPPTYQHGAFIAEHGSWNRRTRTGYQVIFVPFLNGSPAGPPQPFFTGFVPDPNGKQVYGRMVGTAVSTDGSLFLSDDAAKVIWKVSYSKPD
jgi:glucose/arabinose dehydrogenase